MLIKVGVYLSTRGAKEGKLLSLSLLDQVVWKRVGRVSQTSKLSSLRPSVCEEIKLVSLGLHGQVVWERMEGVGWGVSAPNICKVCQMTKYHYRIESS